MKTSKTGLNPELAWALCRGLTKLSLLLWDCYEEEFLKLAEEEKVRRETGGRSGKYALWI
jgi:hypothetical protein